MALTNTTNSEYDLSEELRKQYAANTEAELANLKSAYDKNVAALDNTVKAIPATYDEARRTAAAQGDIAQRNFNEMAAASGLNSGAGGQAALALGAQTRGNLSALDREQAKAIANADLQRANLQAEYESAMAQARANNNAALAGALYDEMARVQNIEAKMAGGGSGGDKKKATEEQKHFYESYINEIDGIDVKQYTPNKGENLINRAYASYARGYITENQFDKIVDKTAKKENKYNAAVNAITHPATPGKKK